MTAVLEDRIEEHTVKEAPRTVPQPTGITAADVGELLFPWVAKGRALSFVPDKVTVEAMKAAAIFAAAFFVKRRWQST